MKIFLIGGSGYIGRNLLYGLIKETNYSIIVIDKNPLDFEFWTNNLKYEKIDLSSPFASEKLIDIFLSHSGATNIVIHLAALKSVAESNYNPDLYWENNFQSTLNIIDAMKIVNFNKIIFSSTAAVYGDSSEFVSENDQLKPISVYAKIKAEEEKILVGNHDWLQSTIFRFFNVAGSLDVSLIETEGENLFPKILKSIISNSKFEIFGDTYNTPDGTCIRDYIHVGDIFSAFLAVINSKHNSGFEIYNLGTGSGYSVLEIMSEFSTILNSKIDSQISEKRAGDMPALIANPAKFKRDTDWNPKFTLKDMVISSLPFIL